jgi:hypothetical protein
VVPGPPTPPDWRAITLGSLVTAVLSGFDRIVFRGLLLSLMGDGGMFMFLYI